MLPFSNLPAPVNAGASSKVSALERAPLRISWRRTLEGSLYLLLCTLACVLLASCASENFRQAQQQLQEGKVEEGLATLKTVVQAEPHNQEAASQYNLRLHSYTNAALGQGAMLRQQGKYADAKTVYEHLLQLDPTNTAAQDALVGLPRESRQSTWVALGIEALKGGDVDKAQAIVRQVLTENPDHYGALRLQQDIEEVLSTRAGHEMMQELALKLPKGENVSMEFRDANLKLVFDALGRSSGVNFVLDKDVRPDLRVSISVRNTPLDEAVKVILQSNQLEYKVLNANSVLVYPSVAEKLKLYQDLVVKAFYLQNADVKQVQSNLKTILKTKDTVIDEKLNLLIMRDTPDVISAAEKIIALQDLKEPEVMLEVEVLEINRSKLTSLGIQWPSGVTLTPLASNSGNGLTLADLRQTTDSTIGVSAINATINLNTTITDADILANPRIRVKNRETAKIMIGEKLPVVTSNVTSNGVISPNVTYLDVGLKLEVQPDIRLKSDIGIKVELEVSSVTNTFTLTNGTTTYQVGTRNASTKLRLRDGETQILGGLINEQEGTSANRIPGIGDLPVLNRIFGSQSDSKDRTELVLSITPHLIRNLTLPAANQTQFWSGTESSLKVPALGASLNLDGVGGADKVKGDGAIGGPNAGTAGTNANASAAATSAGKQLMLPTESAKNVSLTWKAGASVDGVRDLVLQLRADGTVRSLPLQIAFDPAAYQVVSLQEGPYFKRDGASTTFSSNVDAQKGRIYVTTTRNDAAGVGAGEAAVLTIKVRALGSAPGEWKVLSAEPIVASGERPATLLAAPFVLPIVPAAQAFATVNPSMPPTPVPTPPASAK